MNQKFFYGGENMAKYKRISLSIPIDLYKKIEEVKKRKFSSFQAIILESLLEGFNRLYDKEDKKND